MRGARDRAYAIIGGLCRLGRRHSGGVERLSTASHPQGVAPPQPDTTGEAGGGCLPPHKPSTDVAAAAWKSHRCCGGGVEVVSGFCYHSSGSVGSEEGRATQEAL
ncbi:hypothetical protein Tco_1368944 [Tanacetum coccineum]